MQDVDLILNAINTLKDANKESHDAIVKGINLTLDASAYVSDQKLTAINNHLAKLNGTVAELQRESDKRRKAVEDFRELEKKFYWPKKNWIYVLLSAILFNVVVIFLYDVGLLRGTVQWIAEKIINKIF